MKTFLLVACIGVAVLGVTMWSGRPSSQVAAADKKANERVELPKDDPLLAAIQQRLGKPDRVTGSGRMFIHYDLANGDTLTITVSGRKVIGTSYKMKK